MSVSLLSGVPGVGLTTISERARRRLDEEYQLVNFGDVMLEHAATRDWATSRSELATLTRRQTRRLQRRAGEFVADSAETAEILLTTHMAVETDAGYLHGFPDAVLRDVNPGQFVLVEAAPETIRERRAAADRDYGDATARTIEFEQDINRTAAFEYAASVDAPVRHVENDGDVDEAAAVVAEALRTTE
jgi:adenylate kinase